jgi:hypothetical protein
MEGDGPPRLTPKEMREVNQLRHKDPKLARKMRRSGNGNRYAQAMYLAKEGIVGTMATGTTQPKAEPRGDRSFLARIDEATYQRAKRLDDSGVRDNTAFFARLLDAMEAQRAAPAAGTVDAEIDGTLRELQQRYGCADRLATLRKLDGWAGQMRRSQEEAAQQGADLAAARANLAELRQKYDLLRDTNGKQHERILSLKAELDAPRPAAPQPGTEASIGEREAGEILFEFVQAFAGATMTADASGAMRVTLPDTTPFFSIWQRAVAALGLNKRAA